MRMQFSWVVAAMLMGSAIGLAQVGSPPQLQAQENAGSKDRPVRVSSAVILGLLLHKVDPVYPEDAKDAGVSGAVVMKALISDEGKIMKLTVVSGAEKLRDAATTAVNQWKYKPYLLNGKPVFVDTVIVVNFALTQ